MENNKSYNPPLMFKQIIIKFNAQTSYHNQEIKVHL